jgi:S-adenosylmethionine hydrolase
LTAITLTTDFGTADPYVAAMKGVILSINPLVTIVDITHEIPPQGVEEASFVLGTVWHLFADAIHVAVVDPGVGTTRKPIVLTTPAATFVGPDNGILSSALPDEARGAAGGGLARLPPGFAAYQIAGPRLLHLPLSQTFHGRDIFAPAAAYVSTGIAPKEAGPRLAHIKTFPPWRAEALDGGLLHGRVIRIDRFGNLITTIRNVQLPDEGHSQVDVGGVTIHGLSGTYAEGEGLMAYVGSSGYLEIGLPGTSAAAELGARCGDEVILRPATA